MKNKIREAEVLNLNEGMVNSLVKKVESSIFELSIELEKKQAELKEVEEMYLPVKNGYDALVDRIQEEKNTLAALIGFRDNKNERKSIRVFKSISNAPVIPLGKKRRKGYPWTDEAIKIFEKQQRFLMPNTLFHYIIDANPSWKVLYQNVQEQTTLMKKVITNFTSSALKKNGTKDPRIVIYDGKFGLKEWLEAGSLKAKYLFK